MRDTLNYALTELDEADKKALDYADPEADITVQDQCSPDFYTVKTSDSVLAAAQTLAKGCHVIGVMSAEEEGSLAGILTQGQLVCLRCFECLSCMFVH